MILFDGLRGAKWWVVLTAASCGLLLFSNWIYMIGPQPRFLWEKGELANSPLWLAAFYFHVVGASVCLAAGFPLMFPRWTQKHPAWHRGLGYAYFTAVLWMAAPSGVALAFTAKGGILGTLGFALAGILWWYVTWNGYCAIRRGQIAEHIRAMIRSYSLALSAPAFRIIQAALFLAGLGDATNYIVSLWLSIAVSVLLAESCLYRFRGSGAFVTRLRSPLGEMS